LSNKNELRTNRRIRVPEVRLIDQDGKMLGVVLTNEALRLAFEANLDLVEISPNAVPPICRIVDYSKMKYEERKKASLNKKKQKTVSIKEIKMSLNIGENDFCTKIKQSLKFLSDGNKVKFNFVFRGREITYADSSQLIVNKILDATKELAKLEDRPKFEGRRMSFTIAPLKV